MTRIKCATTRIAEASWIVSLLLTVVASTAHAQETKSPTLAEIQKAWQSRQDRVRTARFTWKEQKTWPMGAMSSAYGDELEDRDPGLKGKVMPPADKTVDFWNVLYLENDKCRFEYEGEEFDTHNQTFRNVKYISVFDGQTAKDFYPDGFGFASWPIGTIRRRADYRDAGLASLRPLVLVYRPFVPTLQPTHFQALRIPGRRMVINDRPCVELLQQVSSNSSRHLWIDMARECTLVRQTIIDQGVVREQIDLDYRLDSELGWTLQGWKTISNSHKGGLFCSMRASVTGADFHNSIESSLFDLSFPPGARMINEKTNEEYIIQLNGRKRPILSSDMGATYEQMLNSDPGEALLPQTSQPLGPWWRWAIAAIGALAVGVFVFRRFTIRRFTPGKN